MQKLFVAAVAIAATLASTPSHAEIQRWQLIAKVTAVSDGFDPPAYFELGSEIKITYHVDLDVKLSNNYFPSSVPRIRFNKDGSTTDSGYVLAMEYLTALNTTIAKKREDGVTYVTYNCNGPRQAVTVSEALSFCEDSVGMSSRVSIAFGKRSSVYAEPLSFRPLEPKP